MLIVSACLAGVECRYNGSPFPIPAILNMVKRGLALPVCPEILGGFSIPRPPAEIRHGQIVFNTGEDVTEQFLRGANAACAIALTIGCQKAIVKSKSPSCGCGSIYDGTFSGTLIAGDGIFTQLLKEHGIEVLTEENLEELH